MPQLPPFKGVIFDMDGLLLDTEPTYASAWRRAAADFGVDLDLDFLHGLFGLHADAVLQTLADRIGPSFDPPVYHASAGRYWREHVATAGVPIMPGALALLNWLKEEGIPHALATNSDGPFAQLCLEHSGLLGQFEIQITRDQVSAGKPEPDLFLVAAHRLELAPADCLVLEDSHTGLLAASRAGAIPILINRRLPSDEVKQLARFHYVTLEDCQRDMALA